MKFLESQTLNTYKQNFQNTLDNCKLIGECAGSIIDGLKHTSNNSSIVAGWVKTCQLYILSDKKTDENNLVEIEDGIITDLRLEPESLKTISQNVMKIGNNFETLLHAFHTMSKHSSQKDCFGDTENIKSAIFGSGNKEFNTNEKFLETCEGIIKLVNFASEGNYKNYLTEADTLTESEEGIKQMKACLDICDYMNVGITTNNNNTIQEPWVCISENDKLENNSDSQFFGKVYSNPNTEELIIAFCGTNSVDDLTTDDVQMIKGKVPEQYDAALELYNKYANDEKFQNYKITITGHSLGGALAQLVGSTKGVEADNVITFNAFGAYDILNNEKEKYNFVENPNVSQMFNYITEGDIVSNVSRHIGQTTLVESIGSDLLCNHMLQNMHNYLREKNNKAC